VGFFVGYGAALAFILSDNSPFPVLFNGDHPA
jgi:hypothetical protein